MDTFLAVMLLAAVSVLSGLITLMVAYGFMEALFYSLGRLSCRMQPARKCDR